MLLKCHMAPCPMLSCYWFWLSSGPPTVSVIVNCTFICIDLLHVMSTFVFPNQDDLWPSCYSSFFSLNPSYLHYLFPLCSPSLSSIYQSIYPAIYFILHLLWSVWSALPQISEWWVHWAYLESRQPLPVHSNPAISLPKRDFSDWRGQLVWVQNIDKRQGDRGRWW